MIDFKSNLALGLSAAARAQANRDEIQEILNELNNQISEATQGRLQIFEKYQDPIGSITDTPTMFGVPNAGILTCINPLALSKRHIKIAGWKLAPSGYPCELNLAGEEMYCEDKEATEKALAFMLTDPIVGEVFFKTINSPLASPSNDTPEAPA